MSDPQPIMDLEFLRGLIAAVDGSGIDTVEVSRGGTRVRISKTPATTVLQGSAPAAAHAPPPARETPGAPQGAGGGAAAEAAPAPAASNLLEIKSPMVGTFYRSPAPEAPAYVDVGTRVTRGQTLCILEAMKLMNELECEVSGTIREILVENAEPVEYGQVLFRIEPDA